MGRMDSTLTLCSSSTRNSIVGIDDWYMRSVVQVPEKDLAEDIIADWDNGLEWAVASAILDKRRVDGQVEYLVKWSDGGEVCPWRLQAQLTFLVIILTALNAQDTWEPEQNVEETLIRQFEDAWDQAREERRAARKADAERNGSVAPTA